MEGTNRSGEAVRLDALVAAIVERMGEGRTLSSLPVRGPGDGTGEGNAVALVGDEGEHLPLPPTMPSSLVLVSLRCPKAEEVEQGDKGHEDEGDEVGGAHAAATPLSLEWFR
jgi:hypothetical protein